MNPRNVTIKPGRVVKVVDREDKLMLCAVDRQPQPEPVSAAAQTIINIMKHQKNNWIAFTVNLMNNNAYYILQVKQSSLELVKSESFAPLKLEKMDKIWFEKVEIDDHYKVKVPRSNPEKYICIDESARGVFILGDVNEDHAEVKDEAI